MKQMLAMVLVLFSIGCTSTHTIEGYQHEKISAEDRIDLATLTREQYVVMERLEGQSNVKGSSEEVDERLKDAIERGKSIAVFNALAQNKKADAIMLPTYSYTATQKHSWFWFIFLFETYDWDIEVTVSGRGMRLKTDKELEKMAKGKK